MANKVLQTNVNHARQAHDLAVLRTLEEEMALAVISEPCRARLPRDHESWHISKKETMAIFVNNMGLTATSRMITNGDDYVLIKWGKIYIMGIYLPPSYSKKKYEQVMDEIENKIRPLNAKPIAVMGDINARSATWGDKRTNIKGRILENVMETMGMVTVNRGKDATCIRENGSSIVDVTWASPTAKRLITKWKIHKSKPCRTIYTSKWK